MVSRMHRACGVAFVLALVAIAPGTGLAQRAGRFPYSIMAPEPGTATHRRVTAPDRIRHAGTPRGSAMSLAGRHKHGHLLSARGSSGSVLPTPLPRTELIPPENRGVSMNHAPPQQQGPTILPGMNPIPNLPHGAETFQDRASRCAFQQGLYGVPAGASTQYMGACLQ